MALDKKKFKELFMENYQPLCNYAFSFTKDADKAEDIVQDVFVKLWNSQFTLDKNRNISGYLFTLVRNHSLDVLRRDHLGVKVAQEYNHQREVEEFISSEETNTENYMMLEKLDRSIKALPPKCGEVFLLNKIQGYSHSDIAEFLGISVKTVEAHMTKAYRLLKSQMIFTIILGIYL